jgi:DNA-binding NarL/FixJ family response regulator
MQAAPSLRVLVAEDSAVVRDQLATLFGGISGVELVGLVEDGDTALSAITERGPDVVVLDFRMPGKNGLEVLRAVRGSFTGKVIMLTNFADPLTRRLCFEAGADHFFDKSTEFRDMLRVVRELRDQGDRSPPDPA